MIKSSTVIPKPIAILITVYCGWNFLQPNKDNIKQPSPLGSSVFKNGRGSQPNLELHYASMQENNQAMEEFNVALEAFFNHEVTFTREDLLEVKA